MASKKTPVYGQPVTLRVQDFSGGLNTTVAPALLNDNEAQKADFVNFDQKGTIQPQKGRRKRYADPISDAPVAGLGAFYSKAGTSSLVIAAGTKLYTDDPHLDNVWDSEEDWRLGTVEGLIDLERSTSGALRNKDTEAKQNQKFKVEVTGNPRSGFWTLRIKGSGENIGSFSYANTEASTIQSFLDRHSLIGAGNSEVTGPKGGPWTIEFTGKFAGQELADDFIHLYSHSFSGGTNPTVKVEVQQKGADISKSDTIKNSDFVSKGEVDSLVEISLPETKSYEESDPRWEFVPADQWTDYNHANFSGGVAKRTTQNNAYAVFTLDEPLPLGGNLVVYGTLVDSSAHRTGDIAVDTGDGTFNVVQSFTTRDSSPAWGVVVTVAGLPPGTRRIRIVKTSSSFTTLYIDRIEIIHGAIIYETEKKLFSYSGSSWATATEELARRASGHYVRYTDGRGDSVTFEIPETFRQYGALVKLYGRVGTDYDLANSINVYTSKDGSEFIKEGNFSTRRSSGSSVSHKALMYELVAYPEITHIKLEYHPNGSGVFYFDFVEFVPLEGRGLKLARAGADHTYIANFAEGSHDNTVNAGGVLELAEFRPAVGFIRNSEAYLPNGGTKVGANTPRIIDGGLLIETGTTNLYPDPHMNGGYTPNKFAWDGVGDVYFDGDSILVIDNSQEPTQNLAFISYPNLTGVTGPVTVSMRVRSTNGTDVAVMNYLGTDYQELGIAPASGEWVVVAGTYEQGRYTATPNQHLRIGPRDRLEVDWIQIEANPFATTFTADTRGGEEAVLPADLLDPKGFTLELEFTPLQDPGYPDSSPNRFPKFLQIGDYFQNGSITLWWYRGELKLWVKGATRETWSLSPTVATPPDWYTPGAKRRVKIICEEGFRFWVEVDGEQRGPWEAADPITRWGGEHLWLGSSTGDHYPNAIYHKLKIGDKVWDFSSVTAFEPEYPSVGYWYSPVIDTDSVGAAYALSIAKRVAQIPSDGAINIHYRHSPSADMSDASIWYSLPWHMGQVLDHWSRYIQVRATVTAPSTRTATPRLSELQVTTWASYASEGSFTQNIDLKDLLPSGSKFLVASEENEGQVVLEARTRESGESWSEWVPIESGESFPELRHEVEYRIRLKPNDRGDKSPELYLVDWSIDAEKVRGIWTSDPVDVSQAKDKTTGKVSLEALVGTDTISTQYAYSTDNGATYSEFIETLADGSMVTPEDTTHVKIRLVLVGKDLAVSSATVFFDGEAKVTEVMDGLQPNAEYDFTQFRDQVIIVNGKDLPMKWNNTGPPEPLGGDPPAFQMVETHLNRVWGAGDPENPSRLRYSEILDPDKWPALNFIDFNPEDGDRITGLQRYGQLLVVAKRNAIAILTGDKTTNFTVQWLDHDAGLEGFRGILPVDKYLVYVARDGIRFSDLTKTVRSTERLQGSWNQLNHRRLNQGAIASLGNYMLVALPSKGSMVNDQVWFFDVLRAAWSIIPNWHVSSWLKFHQYGEDILLAGDSTTGQVYQVFTGVNDANGEPVEYDFQTKDFDAGVPERYKVFRDCIIIAGGTEVTAPLKVSFVVDGKEFPVDTADTTLPAGDGVVHSIRLIPPVYGAVLGQRISLRIQGRAHIHGIALGMIVKGIVPGVS